MSPTTVLPKQQSLLKLAGAMAARFFKASPARTRARYVNIGEFSPHLQRDMGFMDGHGVPGPETALDARDRATRDLMR